VKPNDLEKDVPVELTGILGEEALEVDAEPLDLKSLIEGMTGVSFSPYSQQKMVMSNQIPIPSSNAPVFEDIFGEGDIGADQTASIPQSSFIRASEISLDNRTRFVPDPTPRPARPADSFYNRMIARVDGMAAGDLIKTVPSDLAVLVGTEGATEPLTSEQITKNKKFFESLAAKMRKSRSLRFLMDRLQATKVAGRDVFEELLTDKELDELDRLRVIDTERFDCAFPPSL
jgi:hypothetical protein